MFSTFGKQIRQPQLVTGGHEKRWLVDKMLPNSSIKRAVGVANPCRTTILHINELDQIEQLDKVYVFLTRHHVFEETVGSQN